MAKRKIIVYTDGSANAKEGHPGYMLGGFGIYMKIIDNDKLIKEIFFHEGWSHTKTGRMELRAIITSLNKITDKLAQVFIYSDSQYAVNCVNQNWLWNWEKNRWAGVANIDLMKIYLEEFRKFRYRPIITHIKGHTKNEDENSIGNAIADALADYKQFKTHKQDLK